MPILWLQGRTIAGVTAGQPFYVWPDSSYTQNDCVNAPPGLVPTGDTYAGFPAGLSTQSTFLLPTNPITLAGDFALFCVMKPAQAGPNFTSVLFGTPDVLHANGIMVVFSGGVRSYQGSNFTTALIGPNFGALHLLSVRRVGNTLTFGRDGVFTAVTQVPAVVPVSFGVHCTTSGRFNAGSCDLLELQLFDQTLTDDFQGRLTAALRTEYGL